MKDLLFLWSRGLSSQLLFSNTFTLLKIFKMPPYTIKTCSLGDAAFVARNNISAFWTDSDWRLIWTRVGKTTSYVISQAMLRAPQNLLSDPLRRRHFKAVDEESGRLVGYARWLLPKGMDADFWPESKILRSDSEELRGKEEGTTKREFDSADWEYDHALDELDLLVQEARAIISEGRRFVCLDYLAVAPEWRKRGIATALVKEGLRVAERLGEDTFVTACRMGRSVYLRCGFRVIESVVQDDSKFGGEGEYSMTFLVKEHGNLGENQGRRRRPWVEASGG